MKGHVIKASCITMFLLLLLLTFQTNFWKFCLGILISYVCLKMIRNLYTRTIPMDGKAIFITGCDTGFGHMLSIRLDQKGYKVFSGCYLPEESGAEELRKKCSSNLHVLPIDVTSQNSVEAAEEYVRTHLGAYELWGVVNNAGIYAHGDVELSSLDVYKKTADVNLYGMIRVTKAFLPLIRQSQGRIVNMSSIYGRYSMPGSSPYNASKFAVETVSDSLRMEMRKFGVKVSLIEPAMFGGSTNIHGEKNVQRYYSEIDKSWEECSPSVKQAYTKKYMQKPIDTIVSFRYKLDAKSPEPVLDAIEHALTTSNPKYRYVVHGGPFLFDPIAVYGTIYGWLPEYITDWIGCQMMEVDSKSLL